MYVQSGQSNPSRFTKLPNFPGDGVQVRELDSAHVVDIRHSRRVVEAEQY